MSRKRPKCGICGADLTAPDAVRLIIQHVTTLVHGKATVPKSLAVSHDMIDAEEGVECNECGERQSLPPIELMEQE
jgi:DNA-directed RNA polymerase subunit RPC12/RpoP